MIVFLTLLYVGILFLAVKIRLVRMNAFWKVSPVLWMVLLFFVLFVPLQWGAPAGAVNNYQSVIEIIPNVSGEVKSVEVRPLESLEEDDPIFTIDPVQYAARVNQLEAQLVLSRANLPLRSWVAFVEKSRELVVGISQSRLRHVEPGQEVELALRMFPGEIITGKVDRIIAINPAAQLVPSGVIPIAPTPADPALPYGVAIELDQDSFDIATIPGGAVGTAAIYTDSAQATHVIRKVMVRMEAWINYLKP